MPLLLGLREVVLWHSSLVPIHRHNEATSNTDGGQVERLASILACSSMRLALGYQNADNAHVLDSLSSPSTPSRFCTR